MESSSIKLDQLHFYPYHENFQKKVRHFHTSFGFNNNLSITPSLAQLMRLLVVIKSNCVRCVVLHTKIASDMNIAGEKINQLFNYEDSDVFTLQEKIALCYAHTLVLGAPNGFNKCAEALKANFSEAKIIEMAIIVLSMKEWAQEHLNKGAITFYT